jgi:hypothetical protein
VGGASPARALQRCADAHRRSVSLPRGPSHRRARQEQELARQRQQSADEALLAALLHALHAQHSIGLPHGWGWAYYSRPGSSCGLGDRLCAGLASVITVCVNVWLIRLAIAGGDSPRAQFLGSNAFSIFAYAVGIVAAISRSGTIATAFLCYSCADTLFALLPTGVSLLYAAVAARLPPGSVPVAPEESTDDGESDSSSRGTVQVVGLAVTLAINATYNLPCLLIAWRFWRCFSVAPTQLVHSHVQ